MPKPISHDRFTKIDELTQQTNDHRPFKLSAAWSMKLIEAVRREGTDLQAQPYDTIVLHDVTEFALADLYTSPPADTDDALGEPVDRLILELLNAAPAIVEELKIARQVPVKIIRVLLEHYFADIEKRYPDLTDAEKKLVTNEEFGALVRWLEDEKEEERAVIDTTIVERFSQCLRETCTGEVREGSAKAIGEFVLKNEKELFSVLDLAARRSGGR